MASIRFNFVICLVFSLTLVAGCRKARMYPLSGDDSDAAIGDADIDDIHDASEDAYDDGNSGGNSGGSSGGSGRSGSGGGGGDRAVCGNGIIEGREQCDGRDLGNATCATFDPETIGNLYCTDDCRYDTSLCWEDIDVPPLCGNGIIDWGEQCDSWNLGTSTCQNLNMGNRGTLRCTAECVIDTSRCFYETFGYCGDGIVDPDLGEQCEYNDLQNATCENMGFSGGTLSCDRATCTYNTSRCFDCGNDRREGDEECDGSDLAGQTCMRLGYSGGVLRCRGCEFDVSRCAMCGNDEVEIGENCDGDNLDGETCDSLGIGSGTLYCDEVQCLFDTSQCDDEEVPYCGNGVTEPGEQCDRSDLLGATCQTQGFDSGSLTCNTATCRYNTSNCQYDTPSGSDCSVCTENSCSEAVDNCTSLPGCVDGLECIADHCAGTGSMDGIMCGLDCFGGSTELAFNAIGMFGCVVTECGAACLGTF